jgi:hypothetical protein
MNTADFPAIFERLKRILVPFSGLRVSADDERQYALNTPFSAKAGKEIFFGSAVIQKNYVSFYLMPVYMFPDLLQEISPELKKHMQGKSCFNFKKLEEPLFQELEQLAARGIERYRASEWR